ncbi:LacI family DNA-binding transcriptional regulator [Lutibacter flavus]|uniref:Transcriptional regulator, LacI family n=1 Tax=Lutibacter flavus TaxID=691689 RepID=A0A238XBN5_9FLAO|nr:LacI family DNA-binding transcriptional regulator [Lutibacter flavus]SNR55971.1 transcriptional regulator, LacI family [Lutibacter flavus]
MKPTTLKDIAIKLNISVTTVSKALKGYSDVSKTTRAAVFEQAEKMNYSPNSVAVNLRTRQTKTIGAIIPTITHHFFSKVIDGIIEEAEKNGYLVIILQSEESVKQEKKLIKLLMNKRVDGILMSLAADNDTSKHLKKVIDAKIPLVLFDKISKISNCSKVVINDREASYNATTLLINSGCRRIAHFRGPLNPQNSIDRYLGYRKALEDNNIEFDRSLIYTCKNVTFEEGYKFAKEIHEQNKDVDAIFAITDLVAVGAIAYLNKAGIKIPDEISVIGFSNWFMSAVISPPLTTVEQPGYKMGKKAVKLLFEEINSSNKGIDFEPKTIVLKTKIIKRKTTFS